MPGRCGFPIEPAAQDVVSALTVGTENVVDGAGCFRPGACPTPSTSNNQAGTPAIASAQVTADPLPPVEGDTQTSDHTSPQEGNPLPIDQVPSTSQASLDDISGPPVDALLDEQTPVSLNDESTAELQPQSASASLGSGTPPLDDEAATQGHPVNEIGQANIASLIMMVFGSATGSAVSGGPSPEAGIQPPPTGTLSSSVAGTLDSAKPLEPVSPDNDAFVNSLYLRPSSLIQAESIGSPVVFDGNTLQPGSSVTRSATTYALPSSGTAMLVNGSPSPLPIDAAIGSPVIIAGTTIQPGSSVTISETTYALPPSGTAILVNGSPSPLATPFDSAESIPSASNDVALASVKASITPGAAAITISGTTYSKPATGTAIFINGLPSPLPPNILDHISAIQSQTQQSSSPDLESSRVQSPGALVIASQTLQPGQAITVSGNIISLPPTGTDVVVVDGQAQTLMRVAPTGSAGVGDVVFAAGSQSVTADLVEATSTTSVESEVGMNASGEFGDVNATATSGSAGEEVEIGNSGSGGATSVVALEGSGTESRA
ncbi:MAG: hypothetical protein Q9183_002698, partial [Haloplaca sp. 2 TL-2023]